MINKQFFKYARILLLAIYFVFGILSAHQVGISWDEDAEHTTLLTNVHAIEGLYQGDLVGFNQLANYVDRYNGIGFQILAYPITRIISPLLAHFTNLNQGAAELLALHSCIFICFFLSGILIQKILQILLADEFVAWLAMFTYLLWPYLLGHGFMNPKDMPFLLGWLISSYYLILIYQSPGSDRQVSANFQNWIYLGIAVGWMIALRINGLLLFIVYFISFWISSRVLGRKVAKFKKGAILFLWTAILTNFLFTPLFWDSALNVYRGVQFFITGTWDGPPTTPGNYLIPNLGLTYNVAQLSFSPVFWSFPVDLIRALKHFQGVLYQGTTYTAGQHLSALALPSTYIPQWLAVKLSVTCLLGLGLIPFSLWRNKIRSKPKLIHTGLVGMSAGVVMIVAALIVRHARLHDELRHILFIFPMLWIIGICSLYYLSRPLTIGTLILTSIFFIIDIANLHPYEYIWLNEPARFLKIENRYENDYWGTSVGSGSRWLNDRVTNPNLECIYMYPRHLKYYFNAEKFYCLYGFSDSSMSTFTPPEEGKAYWIFRSARFRNLEIPSNCKVVHEEKATLTFSSNPITVAQIYHCK